jgi:hypothetical protein
MPPFRVGSRQSLGCGPNMTVASYAQSDRYFYQALVLWRHGSSLALNLDCWDGISSNWKDYRQIDCVNKFEIQPNTETGIRALTLKSKNT